MAPFVKSLKKNSGTVASITAHASLIQSALGQRAMDVCSANSSSDDISCQRVAEKSFNSWSDLLLMIFTTVLIIAAGLAFYKWCNRGWQQQLEDDAEVNETSESHAGYLPQPKKGVQLKAN